MKKIKNLMYSTAVTTTTMILLAKSAHAGGAAPGTAPGQDASNVLDSITQAGTNIPNFMMMGAYIMGIGFAITGLLKVKEAVENPGKESIKDGLFRLVIGGGLLALGTIMNYMIGTAIESEATAGLDRGVTLTIN